MKRRDFIAGLGGAVAWPLVARAQQSAMPVVGFLGAEAYEPWAERVEAFRQGLSEAGFVEDRNVSTEYRWANGQHVQLPLLAAELVRRNVAVIVAPGAAPAALAAKAATKTIPVVFETAGDPVRLGLVASLNRPGANVTGITSLGLQVVPKRLQLLRELIPTLTSVAVLANPSNPITEGNLRELEAVAREQQVNLHVLEAMVEDDFDLAFTRIANLQAGALLIVPDSFLTSHGAMLGALTARHGVPAIYQHRSFVTAGGLMSYGTSFAGLFRQVGVYTGRVLKGERPADLPVQQATNFELLINLKTAKALKLSIPLTLLGRADEVIE
jgi:putative tryptophan/tyrosine transport system substrate-binding protein